jgi:hypothetical protein
MVDFDPRFEIMSGTKAATLVAREYPYEAAPKRRAARLDAHRHICYPVGLYFLPHQSNMPPMRPPESNAFFCFASRLS